MLYRADNDGHWVACVLEIDSILIILVNVYGYNNDYDRNLLHQENSYRRTANFPTDYLLVGGDFNLTPDGRWPSRFSQEHNNLIK